LRPGFLFTSHFSGGHDVSHIVTITTEVRDPAAVRAACARLGLAEPIQGTARLFSTSVSGLMIALPGWLYPVVCQTETGQIQFDNYENRWGERAQLDQFVQMYAVEKTRLEARKQGYDVLEQPLADGSIKLTVQVGGGA
jgi:hypothetical protein